MCLRSLRVAHQHVGGAAELDAEPLTKRLLAFAAGVYLPPEPPALLSSLTDEVLVMASDVVTATVVEWQGPHQSMSQRGQHQLLTQVVADARGYALDEPFDKALALTIGKRLERQATKVRDDIVVVAAAAAAERQRLCARRRKAASLCRRHCRQSSQRSTRSSRLRCRRRATKSTSASTSSLPCLPRSQSSCRGKQSPQ